MPRDLDCLTSASLKHLRDRWWDETFTDFLKDSLQPRPGSRLLDVGCGGGTAEVSLARLRLPQVELFAVDLVVDRVRAALAAARDHNVSASFAAADALRLPFGTSVFDSTFCVAVLQHVPDLPAAIREFARVTRPGGRVLAVEPDNAARYWYSSLEAGVEAFELGRRFFATLAEVLGSVADPSVGPKVPVLFAQHGIEPLAVHLFPVSVSHLGAPAPAVWESRRETVRELIGRAPDESVRRLGADYVKALDRYARQAGAAGAGFVEIQHTILFATVGQRAES